MRKTELWTKDDIHFYIYYNDDEKDDSILYEVFVLPPTENKSNLYPFS